MNRTQLEKILERLGDNDMQKILTIDTSFPLYLENKDLFFFLHKILKISILKEAISLKKDSYSIIVLDDKNHIAVTIKDGKIYFLGSSFEFLKKKEKREINFSFFTQILAKTRDSLGVAQNLLPFLSPPP